MLHLCACAALEACGDLETLLTGSSAWLCRLMGLSP
jgi:hypothetical protein